MLQSSSNKYISDFIKHYINILDKIAATTTKLKQSQKVSVEEKLIEGKLSSEFSAERISLLSTT
jgi:hypothetical protein